MEHDIFDSRVLRPKYNFLDIRLRFLSRRSGDAQRVLDEGRLIVHQYRRTSFLFGCSFIGARKEERNYPIIAIASDVP